MPQGYSMVQTEVGLSQLRTIRGDQYCAVRATVFQALVTGHPLPRSGPAMARLRAEVEGGATWVRNWTFANRLAYSDVLLGMRDCLEALDEVVSKLQLKAIKFSIKYLYYYFLFSIKYYLYYFLFSIKYYLYYFLFSIKY